MVDAIAALGIFASVTTHRGRVTLEEIKRYSMAAPCALVVVSGGRGDTDTQVVASSRRLTVFIVVKNGTVQSDAAALSLVDELIKLIHNNRWGIDDAELPVSINDDNLYSAQLDAVGVALWAISWEQNLQLTDEVEPTMANFVTFVGDWKDGDKVVMQSIATMEQDP